MILAWLLTGCLFPNPSGTDDPTGGVDVLDASPCVGYRTEVILVDDDGTSWMGCGSDLGLYRASSPEGPYSLVPGTDEWLVYDLERDGDGTLWSAGGSWESSPLLFAVDESGSAHAVELEYSGSAPFMRLSKTQNIAITDDGRRMVDSLTGNYIAYDDGTGSWEEAYYWNEGSLSGNDVGYQMSEIVAHGNELYAVGSIQSQPQVVFLPSEDAQATYHFAPVEPDLGTFGELTGLEVLGPDRFVAVGVDEDSDGGLLLECDGTCDDPTSWLAVDMDAWLEDHGKLWDVAFSADGQRGYAVGERYPQSGGGYVFTTDDGGATWRLSERAHPILTSVTVVDGRALVAGGDGYLAWVQ